MDLKTPLVLLGPTFRMKRRILSKVGLETVEDFLLYVPFRYENNSVVSKIGMLQFGEQVTIQGEVVSTTNIFTKRGITIQKITVEDETGKIDSIFFNQKFILKNIHKGDFVSFAGRVEKFGAKKTLIVRSYEVLLDKDADAIHTTGLVPIYSETRGLFSKWIRNRIKNIIDQIDALEYLPEQIIKDNALMHYPNALESIHFPKSLKEAEAARARLSFDELLIKHAASLIRKKEWEKKQKAIPFEIEKNRKKVRDLIKTLPFELTAAQKKAIEDAFNDLKKQTSMNRLLEGDVGSGKTVVAAIAAYVAYLNGYQTAFMAPTEILANQHFNTFRTILEPFGVKVELFTSSSSKEVKHEAHSTSSGQARSMKQGNKSHDSKFMIHDSRFDIAIGTHALIQKRIKFEKLGLIIIDEQQRFGVEQRAILREKGSNPHLLSMTATPIPRTIFLTIYSDLALSVLDEMPKGRQKIKTWVVPKDKRENGYKWISEKIQKEKSQVFVVCPFIEPSETLGTVKAASEEFERLKKEVFPNFRLGLIHGKLKTAEKNSVIEKFRDSSIDILVATPVIEVGIDIPTADIMIVEDAERFGLAQLHQMRGRVGRGDKQSYCFLYTDSKSDKTLERLGYLRTIDNGPDLAEVDLKLRGPGDMFGIAQHGIPDLKIASLSDLPTIEKARKTAEHLFEKLDKYPTLKQKIEEIKIPKIAKD